MAYERKPPSRGGKPASRGGKSFGDKKPFTRSTRDSADRPKRDFGDRPKRDFGDRPPRKDSFGSSRDGARGDRPPRGDFGDRKPRGDFGDRPKRDFGDRPPRKDFGDRKPRGDFGDRPKRDFGDRPPRKDFGDRKPRGDFGDRPPRREYSSDRPKRDFGDRPPRREGGEGSFERRPRREYSTDRPKRDFGDRPPRKDFGDRPPRGDFGDRKPRGDFGDRPKRDFGDRPPRKDFGDRPKRDFGDRPPRREYSSDRPKRDFGDRPPRKEYGPRTEFSGGDRRVAEKNDPFMDGHELVLFGVHAVQAALKNTARKIKTIWATDRGVEHIEGLHDTTRHPEVTLMDKRDLERKVPEGAVHQGIAMAVEPLTEVFMSDILAAANLPDAGRHVVVILDEVTDPHNVGAVLRSMSVFGAKAMIVHKRNAPGVTGTMAKIATGAVEHIPMVPVVNLGGALEELKNAGFFCLGLDENADYPLSSAPTDGHIALVMGAEGEGLREKTRSLCDAIANIPTMGDIKSLNVSNAAAIALYAVTQSKT